MDGYNLLQSFAQSGQYATDGDMQALSPEQQVMSHFKSGLSLKQFFWAFCSISSRAFPRLQQESSSAEHSSTDTTPTQKTIVTNTPGQAFNEICLYPFLDMLNHQRAHPIEWNTKRVDGHVAFIALKQVSKGQEVFNNYGAKGNENLLSNYGFCLDPNPEDYFKLPLNIKEQDPLFKLKMDKIHSSGLSLIHLLFIEQDESKTISENLNTVLHILTCQDPELLNGTHDVKELVQKATRYHQIESLVALHTILKGQLSNLLRNGRIDHPKHKQAWIAKESQGFDDAFDSKWSKGLRQHIYNDVTVYFNGQKDILKHTMVHLEKQLGHLLSQRCFSIIHAIQMPFTNDETEINQLQNEIVSCALSDAEDGIQWEQEVCVAWMILIHVLKSLNSESSANHDLLAKLEDAHQNTDDEDLEYFDAIFTDQILPKLDTHPQLAMSVSNDTLLSQSRDLFVKIGAYIGLNSVYIPRETMMAIHNCNDDSRYSVGIQEYLFVAL